MYIIFPGHQMKIDSLLKHGAGENGTLLSLERKRFRVFLSSLQYPFSVWWQISGKLFLQRWGHQTVNCIF